MESIQPGVTGRKSGPRLTLQQLANFLTEQGFPISYSTLTKYCSPAINTGPPVEAYWGRRPLFDPIHSLEWAKNRLRSPDNRPGGQSEVAA